MLPDQLTLNVSRLKRDTTLDVGSAGNASSNNYLDPNNRAGDVPRAVEIQRRLG